MHTDLLICNNEGCVCTEWHVSVIALLMFTLSFGLMAIVLSLGGLCTSSLPKKIYYYHSAGEIYIICGEFFLPQCWRFFVHLMQKF